MFKMKKLIIAVVLCAFVFTAASYAQQGGSGLQVSPTRTEMSVLPGEQKDFKISVKNVIQGPVTVKVLVNDFQSDGVSGEPQIIVNEDKDLPNSMKGFVKSVDDFSLSAGEAKEVTLIVDIPADTTPGGYYGVVRFAAVPQGQSEDGQTQVSLNASVASLLFVEVSGDIKEQIQIDSIKIYRDKRSSSLFFFEPNNAAISISNTGNSFSKPFGRVAIKKGESEIYSYELNDTEPRGTVLPNSSRTFTDEIKNVNKFGKYTLVASIAQGQGAEVVVEQISFWYVPIWMAVLAIVLVVVIGIVVWLIYRRMGRKRRRR